MTNSSPREVRARNAAETLRLVQPFLAEAGITRVAELTGLDVGPVCTFAAVRPLSLSLSVTQGKGVTRETARVSAVMEAVEHFHAETPRCNLWQARYDDLPSEETVSWAKLPGRLPRFSPGRPLGWCAGMRVATGRRAWVPLDLVHYDLRLDGLSSAPSFVPTSNGLAAGNTLVEAAVQGLYEVIERDLTEHFLRAPASVQESRRLSIAAIDDQECSALLRGFSESGIVATVWDLTDSLGVPCFLCELLDHPDSDRMSLDARGFGCHLLPGAALSRAICEAAQARITLISGARDDKSHLSPAERDQRVRAAQRQWTLRNERPSPRSFPQGTLCPRSSQEEGEVLVERLLVQGHEEPVVIDLSRANWPVRVARIVAPGLRFETGETKEDEERERS